MTDNKKNKVDSPKFVDEGVESPEVTEQVKLPQLDINDPKQGNLTYEELPKE